MRKLEMDEKKQVVNSGGLAIFATEYAAQNGVLVTAPEELKKYWLQCRKENLRKAMKACKEPGIISLMIAELNNDFLIERLDLRPYLN